MGAMERKGGSDKRLMMSSRLAIEKKLELSGCEVKRRCGERAEEGDLSCQRWRCLMV